MHKNYQSFLLVYFVLILPFTTSAQTDSTFTKELDEVVVTGQYQPQSLQKSVYQVRIINSEQIRLSGASNIEQTLNKQLGFRFSNDMALGFSDVKLNGMGGTNVKILLDGVPLADRYDERVSLSQIDINNIDRIEIVEGPMSVSYGTDAMAGVINIITKKAERNTLAVTAGAQEETAGSEYHPFSWKGVHIQHANIDYSKNKFLISAGGTHNDFDGWGGDTYGRGKEWRPKEQYSGNARLGYVDDQFKIYYRIDGLHEDIVTRPLINMGNYKAVDQNFITNRFIHQLQGEYRFNDKWRMNGFAAITDYQRRTKTTRRNFASGAIEPNAAGENDLSKLNSFAFKTSVQYLLSQNVSFQSGIDINREKASGDRIEGSPAINDYALFLSAELQPADFLKIRPGVRFNSNSKYDAPVAIPSLNTKFELSEYFDLRLAYGYGFRAPTLRELYLTFIDANHNLIGNTDLKAEYANSVNGALSLKPQHWGDVIFSSTLSGFYTAYRNQIDLVMSRTNNTEYTYYNIDRSKTTGGKIENTLGWKNLQLTAGFTYYGLSSSQFDDPDFIKVDERNYLWTPEIQSDITYKLEKLKTTLALFYKYTGARPAFVFGSEDGKDAILLSRTDSYNLADFSVNTEITKNISVRAGIKNIFNVKDVRNNIASNSTSSNNTSLPIGYGRSFFIGLNFNWSQALNKK